MGSGLLLTTLASAKALAQQALNRSLHVKEVDLDLRTQVGHRLDLLGVHDGVDGDRKLLQLGCASHDARDERLKALMLLLGPLGVLGLGVDEEALRLRGADFWRLGFLGL